MSFFKIFNLFLLIITIAIVIIFSIGKNSLVVNRCADSTIFEEVIVNIHNENGAVSHIFSETQNFIDHKYYALPLNMLIKNPLEQPVSWNRNMLSFHAYYILCLLAPFVGVMSGSLLLILVQTACFFGLLIAVYVIVNKQTGSKAAPFLFLPFVLLNPNWIGGIVGQFYPDRIFVLIGFLLCYVSYRKLRGWVIFFAIISALINERAALIGGGSLLFITFFSHKKVRIQLKYSWIEIILGILLLVYAFIEKKYILSNVYYDGNFLPGSFSELCLRFSQVEFSKNAIIFLISNLLLLAFAFVNLPLAFLAILVMLLNICGNIGGAEKTGWLTHYHSYYFPILVFGAALGFSNLYKKHVAICINKSSELKISFIYLVLLFFTAASFYYQGLLMLPSSFQPVQSFVNLIRHRPTGISANKELESMFPINASVSTDELGMTLLHNRTLVSLFPGAVSKCDYLFIPYNIIQSEEKITPDSNNISFEWLIQNGFDPKSITLVRWTGRCRISRFQKKDEILIQPIENKLKKKSITRH